MFIDTNGELILFKSQKIIIHENRQVQIPDNILRSLLTRNPQNLEILTDEDLAPLTNNSDYSFDLDLFDELVNNSNINNISENNLNVSANLNNSTNIENVDLSGSFVLSSDVEVLNFLSEDNTSFNTSVQSLISILDDISKLQSKLDYLKSKEKRFIEILKFYETHNNGNFSSKILENYKRRKLIIDEIINVMGCITTLENRLKQN